MLKKAFLNKFAQDVAKLLFGTISARIITVAALPLLTRIYSPKDFAALAILTGLISIIAIASSLRYEIAIPLAENDNDAAILSIISVVSQIFFLIILVIIILLYKDKISMMLENPDIGIYLWLVPIGVSMTGFYSIVQNYSVRKRWFSKISRIRITQTLVGSLISLVLGWNGIAPLGLIIGNLINSTFGGFSLSLKIFNESKEYIKKITWDSFKRTAKKYKKYPIYSAPESLFNTAANQVSIILIGIEAGAEAGFLALAMQIIVLPTRLMGGAISQVYISRAPEAMRNGRLKIFTKSITANLAKMGLGPFLMLGVLSPFFIPIVFGEKWNRSGEIISWLVPWTLLQFIVAPVSMALHVVGKNKISMLFQLFGMIFRIGGVVIAIYIYPEKIVELFAITSMIFYAIYYFMVLRSIDVNRIEE